jgi:hypothetical protein
LKYKERSKRPLEKGSMGAGREFGGVEGMAWSFGIDDVNTGMADCCKVLETGSMGVNAEEHRGVRYW